MLKKIIIFLNILFSCLFCFGQEGRISGIVTVNKNILEYATISISTSPVRGTYSDMNGRFLFEHIPYGKYTVTVSHLGFEDVMHEVSLSENNKNIELNSILSKTTLTFDDIVVTGTKTFKRKTNSPVIINVLSKKSLDNVQACNLSEGLKFQPGLRVETDCQTCNYTQLRINGLAGGYSQILINGRPIFSPLTGLYGLEQLPSNMIDRIEVIRGGGSSLYGSSAIGGTVNVMTRLPKENSYEINSFYQNINGGGEDFNFNGNASLVNPIKKSGLSFFLSRKERSLYDHNEDNFSELPQIENTSFGSNLFFLPSDNQKIELSLSNIKEYRYGGEMVVLPAFLTQQSEERNTNLWMASFDYQINFNDGNSSVITYAAYQNTDREHYTGIFPGDSLSIQSHLSNPPYGNSITKTIQSGVQLNHRTLLFGGDNTFTIGAEYIFDDVYDEIQSYNYKVDQITKNFGSFIQSDWSITNSLSLLSGVRLDLHNLIDKPVFNPRISVLYKLMNNTQFRLNYGTGFRAPQAFDTDLHIAFAGGGISRVILSPDLAPEQSNSFSTSINYDKLTEKTIAGFTLEAFYTRLNNVFFLEPIGQDIFGEQFEKRNGQGAIVKGITLELRANYNRIIQIETGFTIQSNEFDNDISYINDLQGLSEFIRTPNHYGFASLTYNPNKKINANLNYIYTGKMKVLHFAGAPNQLVDEIITTETFSELNLKIGYSFFPRNINSAFEFYGGIKNILNSYQGTFDIGKNRDSNFVYGPSMPRVWFFGIKHKSK